MLLDTQEYRAGLLEAIREGVARGEIKLIYSRRGDHGADGSYLRAVAEAKRFLENWAADGEARAACSHDPGAVARGLGLGINPEDLRALWDPPKDGKWGFPCAPLLLRYQAFILEKLTHRNRIREGSAPDDARFRAWRRNQVHRATNHLPSNSSESIVHAPFAVELTNGCSVGCWFCGISAPRLDDVYRCTPENRALWRDVLGTLRDVYGGGAKHGFCYWATDPFDNPDYERFLCDFHEILGSFPQTTTALAARHLDRARSMLELSRSKGGYLDRFSLLTLAQVKRIHETFSPLELLHVELILQNKEAFHGKHNAGRAMERSEKQARSGKNANETPSGNSVSSGTIACVTGFLISMVKQTVKLVSPCEACAEWPLGYIVFDQGSFSDGASFRQLLERLIEDNMALTVRTGDRARFRRDLAYEEAADGFDLVSSHHRKKFRDASHLPEIGRLVRDGGHTVGDIVQQLTERHDAEPAEVFHVLNLMLDQGVLQAEIRAAVPRQVKQGRPAEIAA